MHGHEKSQCAHPNCTCATAPNSKYCSPYCESAKKAHRWFANAGNRAARANSHVSTRLPRSPFSGIRH